MYQHEYDADRAYWRTLPGQLMVVFLLLLLGIAAQTWMFFSQQQSRSDENVCMIALLQGEEPEAVPECDDLYP